ncbi:DNA recombination protein RecN [Micromonospora taraxaci]|uniref:DNA recombination protein RecN n=1 Tax=Micromonospora taraxaci TaxID=1316803 RepID=UPI0034058467
MSNPSSAAQELNRGIRLLRLRLAGVTRPYEVDLRTNDGSFRPLSVIAGPTNTGKTSVLQLIAYALGASSYPDHEEIVRQVRAAVLETITADGPMTFERGIESKIALVFDQPLDRAGDTVPQPHPIDPPSDPASLSRLLLSTVDLQDVLLRVAPTQQESATHVLSFRDLMWLCMLLNERVGSAQLLFEGNRDKNRKLLQVVDAVFGVHANDGADLASRIKNLNDDLASARNELASLEQFIREQDATPREQLQEVLEDAEGQLAAIRDAVHRLDQQEATSAEVTAGLRNRHQRAAHATVRARQRLRDREALVSRYASLRAQYSDDIRKLTLLKQAGSVFDHLSVTVCPACLNTLPTPPTVRGSTCSLCEQALPAAVTATSLGAAAALREIAVAGLAQPVDEQNADGHQLGDHDHELDESLPGDGSAHEAISAELASTRSRFKELNDYWRELADSLPTLRQACDRASTTEAELAAQVDRGASGTVTPYVAAREDLAVQRQAVLVRRDRATAALKQWRSLQLRRRRAEQMAGELAGLRRESRSQSDRPDRDAVITALSARFRQILNEVGYPKHNNTGAIDAKLVPSARMRPFTSASSGGQVLQSLAWVLAIFEVGYETGAHHPGFLLIDTPQKNLGGKAAADDEEFADVHLVERFYQHVISWLGGPGRGAQIVIVDNTPPPIAEPHIAARFTRDPHHGRFGLIDNETG